MKKQQYKFRTDDFWKLIESQQFKCALTGRELTEINTEVEHKVPLKKDGKHTSENLYMIDESLCRLARYLTEDDIIHLAAEIIKYRGKEHGYSIKKV